MADKSATTVNNDTVFHPDNTSTNEEAGRIPLYVGIGASAGGLEAIQSFFEHIPSDFPLPFIVVQHLSPDYKSLMVELLSKKTKIPVKRAEDGMLVESNTIYLIPPKKNLQIFHGKLVLSEQDHSRGVNLPIDIFFTSLAEDQGERAVAIVLSGTGSDGMRGVRTIKEQGGLVFVQQAETAKFDGMPRAAISTGVADFVLAPDEMPKKLVSCLEHPYIIQRDRAPGIAEDEIGLTRIFTLLRERYKIDFTHYKPTTITRRVERRMTVNQIVDINEYAVFAERTPSEVSTLYRELLIGVTRFFRDVEAFRTLMEEWMPMILEDQEQSELRFWVAGCSTGEEAYSIAIAACEGMEQLGVTRPLKIFATDVDRDAIARASAGVYPESIAADVSTELLMKYFYRKDESFHVVRRVREMVVFAQHNLVKDPPFTQIDLVTCRNLLIYLQPVLQKQVFNMLNFSLRPGGILMLGLSETVGELHDLFEECDSKHKIYRSRGKSNRLPGEGSRQLKPSMPYNKVPARAEATGRAKRGPDDEQLLQRFIDTLAGDFIPLSFVVNEHLEIQHVTGDTTGLFHLPTGRPVNDISKMAAKEVAIPLSTGIQKVFRSRKVHRFTNIQVQRNGDNRSLNMTIKPLPERRGQEPLVAVIIEETTPVLTGDDNFEGGNFDMSREAEEYQKELEHELQFTRENLQATIEELETSNEELQATNEELLASNEELQSTNEELQSTNEELHSVNAQYQNKIIELTELNNDIDNLMTTSFIGKLLLDENLEIRRLSSFVKTIFKVLESDIGRPLTHLSHNLVDVDPVQDVRKVMATGEPLEKEVRSSEGNWYRMRVHPYQVGPETYSGTVLSFLEITDLKKSRDELEESNKKLKDGQEIAGIGYWEYDLVADTLHWSAKIYEIFELDPATFTPSYETFLECVHPEDRERLDSAYRRSVEENEPYDLVHRLPMRDGRIKFVREVCRSEYDEEGKPLRSVGIVQDITAQKQLDIKLSASETRYRELFDTISNGVAVYEAVDDGKDFIFRDFNKAAEQIENINRDELRGKRVTEVFPAVQTFGLLEVFRRVWRSGEPEVHPLKLYTDGKNSSWRENRVYKLPTGEVVAVYDRYEKSEIGTFEQE